MPMLLTYILIGLSLFWSTPSAWSIEPRPEDHRAASGILDLLKAETLDTVSFQKPIHFITPEIQDVVANSETYRLMAGENNQLRLVWQPGKRSIVVEALVISHSYDITSPIALYAQDDEKFPHVLLLMPGGKGLEAVGSYDAVRTRGARQILLSREQIGEALRKKQTGVTLEGKP